MALTVRATIDSKQVIEGLVKERTRSRKSDNGSVLVGYTAKYAMYVHELVGMKLKGQKRRSPAKGRYWDPQGRAKAKFLEEPFRRSIRGLVGIIRKRYKKGAGLVPALMSAGRELKRLSVRFAPKETGALRKSAFVKKE